MTQRLLGLAQEHWVMIDGEASWRGLDLLDLDIDRFLNAIYRYATQHADAAGIRRFDMRLWIPPAGVAPTQGPWSPEAETSAFRSVKAALGIKDPGKPPPE